MNCLVIINKERKSYMKKYNQWTCCALLMLWGAVAMACHSHDEHGEEGHAHETETGNQYEAHETGEGDAHENRIVLSAAQAQASGVKVEKVAYGTFHPVFPASGSILPAVGTEETLSATTSGLVELPDGLPEGKAVGKGQTLAWISAHDVEAGSPLEKAHAEYEAARKELARAETLAAKQIVSDRELQEARLRFRLAEADFGGLKGKADSKGVRIVSPIAGFVKQRLVEPGDYVAVGQPIAVVTQDRRLQLRVEVSERYADRLAQVRSANFRTGAQSQVVCMDSIHGRMVSKGRSVVPGAFYIPVIFEFDNVGNLISGSFAEVWLLGAPRERVLTIPVAALTEEQGVYYVYVKEDAEHYVKTEVTPGDGDGQRVEILRGLKEDDDVVVSGAVYVKLAANAGIIPEGHNHNH